MLSEKVLQMLYFSYVHSIISYSIIFWGNTPNSIKIFRKGRKKLIIITNSKKTLPFYSQYIFSLLMYVANNKHLCAKNLEVHNHNTRSANNFHAPIT
jgi:hypothetical protein